MIDVDEGDEEEDEEDVETTSVSEVVDSDVVLPPAVGVGSVLLLG